MFFVFLWVVMRLSHLLCYKPLQYLDEVLVVGPEVISPGGGPYTLGLSLSSQPTSSQRKNSTRTFSRVPKDYSKYSL
jgi:hypothetical protein